MTLVLVKAPAGNTEPDNDHDSHYESFTKLSLPSSTKDWTSVHNDDFSSVHSEDYKELEDGEETTDGDETKGVFSDYESVTDEENSVYSEDCMAVESEESLKEEMEGVFSDAESLLSVYKECTLSVEDKNEREAQKQVEDEGANPIDGKDEREVEKENQQNDDKEDKKEDVQSDIESELSVYGMLCRARSQGTDIDSDYSDQKEEHKDVERVDQNENKKEDKNEVPEKGEEEDHNEDKEDKKEDEKEDEKEDVQSDIESELSDYGILCRARSQGTDSEVYYSEGGEHYCPEPEKKAGCVSEEGEEEQGEYFSEWRGYDGRQVTRRSKWKPLGFRGKKEDRNTEGNLNKKDGDLNIVDESKYAAVYRSEQKCSNYYEQNGEIGMITAVHHGEYNSRERTEKFNRYYEENAEAHKSLLSAALESIERNEKLSGRQKRRRRAAAKQAAKMAARKINKKYFGAQELGCIDLHLKKCSGTIDVKTDMMITKITDPKLVNSKRVYDSTDKRLNSDPARWDFPPGPEQPRKEEVVVFSSPQLRKEEIIPKGRGRRLGFSFYERQKAINDLKKHQLPRSPENSLFRNQPAHYTKLEEKTATVKPEENPFSNQFRNQSVNSEEIKKKKSFSLNRTTDELVLATCGLGPDRKHDVNHKDTQLREIKEVSPCKIKLDVNAIIITWHIFHTHHTHDNFLIIPSHTNPFTPRVGQEGSRQW